MLVELNQPCNAADHISLLVHDDQGSGAKGCLRPNEVIKVHHNILTHAAVAAEPRIKLGLRVTRCPRL